MKKQKTFAQRAKEIEKKFEGRNDSVSLRTKKALMDQLRQEQEAVKAKMEMQNSGASLDELMVPDTNQAMFGKLLPMAGSFLKENKEQVGQLGQSLVGAGMNIFGKSNMDTSGVARPDIEGIKKQNTANAISSGAKTLTSFASGDILGGVTGAVETIGGLIGGGKQKRAAEKAVMNNDLMQSNNARPDTYMAAYGGKMNSYAEGGTPSFLLPGVLSAATAGVQSVSVPNFKGGSDDYHFPETKTYSGKPFPKEFTDYKRGDANLDGTVNKKDLVPYTDYIRGDANLDGVVNKKDDPFREKNSKFVDWMGRNAGNILQYAPVIGALTNKMERASTPRGSRLTGEVSLGRRDEERLINDVRSQNNISGASREGSGGSLSAYNTLSRSANMNELMAISKARQAMEDSNLSQEEKEVAMNERNRAINVQLDDKFIDREAQDEGAYQTAKQANRDAIFQSLGNIGREEVNKKIVKEMFDYTYDGQYVKDKKGKIVKHPKTGKPMTKEELEFYKNSINQ